MERAYAVADSAVEFTVSQPADFRLNSYGLPCSLPRIEAARVSFFDTHVSYRPCEGADVDEFQFEIAGHYR